MIILKIFCIGVSAILIYMLMTAIFIACGLYTIAGGMLTPIKNFLEKADPAEEETDGTGNK